MSLGMIITKVAIGLVVLLVMIFGVWNTANAAFNSDCGFGISISKCAKESYENSEELSAGISTSGSSSDGQVVTAVNCEAEIYGLELNGERITKTSGAVLIKDEVNKVKFLRNIDDERGCRLTLMVDGSLYREQTRTGLSDFGWSQDCTKEFAFTFEKGKNTSITGDIQLDSIVFCPGISDTGVGRAELWAASEKILVVLKNQEDIPEEIIPEVPENAITRKFYEEIKNCINSEQSKCSCNISEIPESFKIHTGIGVKSLTAQTISNSGLSQKGLIVGNANFELPEFNLCTFPALFAGPYYNDNYLLVQDNGNFFTRSSHISRVFPYVNFARSGDAYKISSPPFTICAEGTCEGEYVNDFITGLKFYKPNQRYYRFDKEFSDPSERDIEVNPSLREGWHSGSSRAEYERVEYPEDENTLPTICVLNFQPRYNDVCE